MRAALTIWEGRVSPVFDVSRQAVLLEVENGVLVGRAEARIEAAEAAGKVDRLLELGVDTLICGAISEPLRRQLLALGIRVIAFVAGDCEAVVAAFVAGRLPSPKLSMPGCMAGRRPPRRPIQRHRVPVSAPRRP